MLTCTPRPISLDRVMHFPVPLHPPLGSLRLANHCLSKALMSDRSVLTAVFDIVDKHRPSSLESLTHRRIRLYGLTHEEEALGALEANREDSWRFPGPAPRPA